MDATENLIIDYKFPKNIVNLSYTKHAQERLKDRLSGSIVLAPTYIRLTAENTIDLITIKKNIVVGATAVIRYKENVNMFLPISLQKGGMGLVKTVYFKNAKNKRFKQRKGKLKKDWVEERNEKAKAFIYTENKGESRENVEPILGNLGGKKESRWKKLFRAFWSIFRTRSS